VRCKWPTERDMRHREAGAPGYADETIRHNMQGTCG
jgi:hypothetical protein